MAVTANWFGLGMRHVANGAVVFPSDTIKVMLTTSAFTPNQDTHDYRDDITNEITGTGYSAGGIALTNKTLTYVDIVNEVRFDSDDAQWNGATFTARYAVFYKARGGGAAQDELLWYINFGADVSAANGPFLIQAHASGWAKITVA